MKAKSIFTIALVGLVMASLTTTAGAKQAHVDKTITSISASKTDSLGHWIPPRLVAEESLGSTASMVHITLPGHTRPMPSAS